MAKGSKAEKKGSSGKGHGIEGWELAAIAICPLAIFSVFIDAFF
jgi:hypothetical protein